MQTTHCLSCEWEARTELNKKRLWMRLLSVNKCKQRGKTKSNDVRLLLACEYNREEKTAFALAFDKMFRG